MTKRKMYVSSEFDAEVRKWKKQYQRTGIEITENLAKQMRKSRTRRNEPGEFDFKV
jgi:hypothetical protein